jgi:hypothetical protein
MSALLIFLVFVCWVAVLYFFGYYLGFFIPKKWIRKMIGVITAVAFFTLPVWDEIKGAQEFEMLCRAGGVYQISPDAAGKKFDLKYSSTESKSLTGFARPVKEETITYTDVATNAVIVTGKAYSAGGGWLVRTLGRNPITGGTGSLIGRDQCSPNSGKTQDDVVQFRRLRAVTNKVVN